MRIPVWPVAAFAVVFIIREILTYRQNLKGKYIFTPLTTISVICVVISSISICGFDQYRGLVLLSLVCALAADTLLMIVEVDLLKFGIVYFLMGHILYIAAFSSNYAYSQWNIPVAVALLIPAVIFFFKLKGRSKGLDAPVFAYLLIICIMVFFAMTGFAKGISMDRVFVAAGALLFAASDTVLAVNAFIKKIPHSTVFTWALYGPAQLLIALSCFD